MTWIPLDTAVAFEDLMDRFGWFHVAEPNSSAHRHIDPDAEAPAIDIVAASMAWRPLDGWLGPVTRHDRMQS